MNGAETKNNKRAGKAKRALLTGASQADKGKGKGARKARNQQLRLKAHQLRDLVARHAAHAAKRPGPTPQPKPTPRGGGGNGVVVGLGPQPRKGMGPRAARRATGTPRPPVRKSETLVRYFKPGSPYPHTVAVRHPSSKGYFKSLQELKSSSVGINESTQYHGARFDEHEFMQGADRHVRLAGRELLGILEVTVAGTEVYSPGGRLGLFPISPDFIGGRLGRMAQEFEQHRAHHLRVLYEPVVPTTTSGAVVLYFNNDVGVPVLEVGENELAHAATHKAFIQTPVWQAASLDIDPGDALNRYFDEESSDFRFEVQGTVTVEAASLITLDVAEADGPSKLGNVYLEYDFEFFAEVLDYSVPMRVFSSMTVLSNVTVGNRTTGQPIFWLVGAATAAGYPTINSIGVYPSGVTSDIELTDYLFVGRIVNLSSAAGGWRLEMPFQTGDDNTERSFTEGECFFLRFHATSTSTVRAAVYGDLASAGSADPASSSGVPIAYGDSGQLAYVTNAVALATDTMDVHGFWVALS
jgi:hypothetical protein